MSILGVLVHPHPILRQPCVDVVEFGAQLHSTAQNMFETMAMQNGVGLAAPQVGLSDRFFVVGYKKFREVFVNPVILNSKGKEIGPEGCLSIPGVQVDVERAKKVTVRYQTLGGDIVEDEFKGFVARIIQHELDHLNGVLILDRGEAVGIEQQDENA